MVLTFGKHKGEDLEDVPTSYLEWITTDLDETKHPEVVKAANEELKFRKKFGSDTAVSL